MAGDLNWLSCQPENTRYIYTGVAQQGMILPAGFPALEEHAMKFDGSSNEELVLGDHYVVGQE